MIHAQLTDGETVHREQDFNTFDDFCKANELAVIHTDQNLYWISAQVGHCECCNTPYDRTKGILMGRKGFCSDDCADEFAELASVLVNDDDHGPADSDPFDRERPQW